MLRSLLILSALVFWGPLSYADQSCDNFFPYPTNDIQAPLPLASDEFELRFMTLNAFEFNLTKHSSKRIRRRNTRQAGHIAEVIRELRPDIITLQEVYSRKDLDVFNSAMLGDEYRRIQVRGNEKGNGIGFLIHRDLNINIETRSFRNRTWNDPSYNGEKRKLFTRDAPALIFRESQTGQVLFIVMGHHAKSQRDRKGDPGSFQLRSKQTNQVLKITAELEREFGDVPIILAGDFNTSLNRSKEAGPLRRRLRDTLNLLPRPPPFLKRITHNFFPDRSPAKRQQLDGIMINWSSRVRVLDAEVYRYKDSEGRVIPLPENPRERDRLPSDHYPVWADLAIRLPYD